MQSKDWVELLKFPLTILIAIIAVVIGSVILNVKPSDIEVGDFKVRLETKIKKDILASNIDIEDQIRKEVEKQLLEQQPQKNIAKTKSASSRQTDFKPLNDVVSDAMASMAKVSTKDGFQTVYKSTVGYIGIASYDIDKKELRNVKIDADNLNQITVGKTYIAKDNLVIRKTNPKKVVDYYEDADKIGIVVKGVKIKLLDNPVEKILEGTKHYWVKVEVLE
ncbi:MAG: hypothetical protein PF489_10130 [Salinivirgaceae bacterium]|jgi:hypothetical protein|nr:hypothetical protein [Salinivirgaceae bacterium]